MRFLHRRFRDFLKNVYFDVYKFGLRCGFHLLPDHYYVPVANVLELQKTVHLWANKSEMPGVAIDLDEQVENLRRVCLPFQKEYLRGREHQEAVAGEFGPGYGFIESQALHSVVRHYKPRRIIEVGSGVSTYCISAALDRNREEAAGPSTITCIEPNPSDSLRRSGKATVLAQRVQTLAAGFFSVLEANDLLFIDSSHTVKPGGDVNYLILEVLPRLRKGVIVHFHDIYFPYDYQRDLLRTFLQYSETALLHAFLIGNSMARILFCLSQLHYERHSELTRVFPDYDPQPAVKGLTAEGVCRKQHFPSSLYLRIL